MAHRSNTTVGKNNLKDWLIGTEQKPGFLSARENGYRGSSGMSVEEFALSMGMRRASIYYFMEDANRPSPDTLMKICNRLGVSFGEGLKHVDPRVPGRPPAESSAGAKRAKDRGIGKKMSDGTIPKTEFSAKLQHEMQKRMMSINDVRDVTKTAYETARRFCKGMTPPSDSLIKIMSDHFGWDFEEVHAMAIRDRERIKYGDLLDRAHNDDPDLKRLERAWPLLSKGQRMILMEQVSTYLVKSR